MGKLKGLRAMGGITMLLGFVILSSGLLFQFAVPAEPHVVYERDISANSGSVTFDEVNDPANIIGVLVQANGCQEGNDGNVLVSIGSAPVSYETNKDGRVTEILGDDSTAGVAGKPCAFLGGSLQLIQHGYNPAGLASSTVHYRIETDPAFVSGADSGPWIVSSGKIKLYVREADLSVGTAEPQDPGPTEETEAPSPEDGNCVDGNDEPVSCAPKVPLDQVDSPNGGSRMATWLIGGIITALGALMLLFSAFRK